MEKWYNEGGIKYWWFEELKQGVKGQAKTKWEKYMYDRMENFMEFQIMGKVEPPKKYFVGNEVDKVFNK